jgi:hypothetical protein
MTRAFARAALHLQGKAWAAVLSKGRAGIVMLVGSGVCEGRTVAKTLEKDHGLLNKLYYGDNLDVLRQNIRDESVDLVYLDPPFNSNRSYSMLFKDKSGEESQAQMEAFDDTWTWSHEVEAQYLDLLDSPSTPNKVKDALEAMRRLLRDNDVLAYLVMMTARLLELRRVLKPTGSIYLHCDPTASHYLKIILDAIFGPETGITVDYLERIQARYEGWVEIFKLSPVLRVDTGKVTTSSMTGHSIGCATVSQTRSRSRGDRRDVDGYTAAAAKMIRAGRDTSICEVSMAMVDRSRSWWRPGARGAGLWGLVWCHARRWPTIARVVCSCDKEGAWVVDGSAPKI